MDAELFAHIDWVEAATRAHMILCQALSDEELDALLTSEPRREQFIDDPLRAA